MYDNQYRHSGSGRSNFSGRNNNRFSRGNNRFGGGNRRGGRGRKKEEGLHPSVYTQAAKPPVAKDVELIKFADLDLHPKVLKCLQYLKYETATEVQSKVIIPIQEGKNLIAISETGSGKTAAFLIPIMDKIIKDNAYDTTKVLILAPTRELAVQIENEIYKLGMKQLGLYATVCIGGQSIGYQASQLRRKNQFIVATPGRLIDLHNRKMINLSSITHLVVDEMDRMLDMGFIDDVRTIVAQTTNANQKLFFSATVETKIRQDLYLMVPSLEEIVISNPHASFNVDQTLRTIQHHENKLDLLSEILQGEDFDKTLIFANTKSMVEQIAESVSRNGIQANFFHGDLRQNVRQRTLNNFKRSRKAVLVATDIAARGIDVSDINLVINYDEPKTIDEYIHRIGRTGRAGKSGKAITFKYA